MRKWLAMEISKACLSLMLRTADLTCRLWLMQWKSAVRHNQTDEIR